MELIEAVRRNVKVMFIMSGLVGMKGLGMRGSQRIRFPILLPPNNLAY
jgi:hypothetical protein